MPNEKNIDKPETDILDDIRNTEKKIKKMSFLKMIPKLKDMAREVNMIKKRTELLLEEFDISEKDSKRIIDFINALPDVQVTKEDVAETKGELEDEIESIRQKMEDTFQKNLERFSNINYVVSDGMQKAFYTTGTGIGDWVGNVTSTGGDNISLTSGGSTIDVKM